MSTLAWHFVGDTLRDGSPVPADGEWLVHTGEAVMCKSGLHASLDPFDALTYAPCNILCRVECDGIVASEHDKLVCRRRMIVRRIDATDLLRSYARWCALSVIHLWDAPAVVREYLETGDERKRAAAWDAARDAARAAARASVWAVASVSAWDAARDAAWDAARAAARDAAWDAARDAAWDAARDAVRTTQRAEFNRRVQEAFR